MEGEERKDYIEESSAEESAALSPFTGINPLAVVIPLIALFITVITITAVLAARHIYVRHEARNILEEHKEELTQSAFIKAIKEGAPDLVKRYLDAGLSSTEQDINGRHPLNSAIERGNLKILELLLSNAGSLPTEHGARITFDEKTPLEQSYLTNCTSDKASAANYAASKSRPAVLALLEKYGAELNSVNGWGPLACAVSSNNTVTAEWLLDQGMDPNRLEASGRSALGAAIYRGSVGAVQLLLERGADPFAVELHGETAIFDAARTGDEAIVTLLLQKPIDLNKQNFRGEKAWQVAEASGQQELIPLLHPEYLLYAGLAKQNPKIVFFALEHGARINISDRDGITPLLVALSDGTPAQTRYLLKSNAGLTYSGEGSSAPVLVNNSALSTQMEQVRRLIRQLESRNEKPSDSLINEDSIYSQLSAPPILMSEIDKGNPPRLPGSTFGAIREDSQSLIEVLIFSRADTRAIDADGNTALLYAVQRGELPIIQLLLKNGATDYEKTNKQGLSPLLHAVRMKRPDIAMAFLNYNPPVNRDGNTEAVLLAAAETGQNGVAEMLLRLGVSPEINDKAGRSLMVIALSQNNFELAKFLRDHGASLDLTERSIQSLYLYARREKQERLRRFLDENATGGDKISVEQLQRVIENREAMR